MILLADANVLIDLGYVDALKILGQMGTVEVLDLILMECEHHPRQPDLMNTILQSGIQQIQTELNWASAACVYRRGDLSIQDALNLYYAKTSGRLLLTNEKLLHSICQQEQVLVRDTLWILKEACQRSLISREQLCQWLQVLAQLNQRLATGELKHLKQKLGCLS